MQRTPPPAPPSYGGEEELQKLLEEGLSSGESLRLTPEAWQHLRNELEKPGLERPRSVAKLAF